MSPSSQAKLLAGLRDPPDAKQQHDNHQDYQEFWKTKCTKHMHFLMI